MIHTFQKKAHDNWQKGVSDLNESLAQQACDVLTLADSCDNGGQFLRFHTLNNNEDWYILYMK